MLLYDPDPAHCSHLVPHQSLSPPQVWDPGLLLGFPCRRTFAYVVLVAFSIFPAPYPLVYWSAFESQV